MATARARASERTADSPRTLMMLISTSPVLRDLSCTARSGIAYPFERSLLLCLAQLGFRAGDLRRQALEFVFVEHVRVHHADEQSFHRAAAKTVNDTLHGSACYRAAILRGAIEIGALLHGVREVALFLQTAQDSTYGGFLE